MDRSEIIDLIRSTAAELDDERMQVLLNVAQTLADKASQDTTATPSRALTPRELAGIEQSKADFAQGRVLDQQQYDAEMSGFMAQLKSEDISTS